MAMMIDIRSLKNFARRYLKDYPLIHNFILEDENKLSAEEFILKIKIWLKLLEREID